MHTLGIVLIVLSIFYVYLIILRPPWIMNNIKVKTMIKWWGVKGFWIFFVSWTILMGAIGILFINMY